MAHKADVQITDTGDGYEIVVEDEGPGIPDDDRQRVFEPFVRLESSRNEATGGTGLGLTLVKAIVEGHGGAVRLENRPGWRPAGPHAPAARRRPMPSWQLPTARPAPDLKVLTGIQVCWTLTVLGLSRLS